MFADCVSVSFCVSRLCHLPVPFRVSSFMANVAIGEVEGFFTDVCLFVMSMCDGECCGVVIGLE